MGRVARDRRFRSYGVPKSNPCHARNFSCALARLNGLAREPTTARSWYCIPGYGTQLTEAQQQGGRQGAEAVSTGYRCDVLRAWPRQSKRCGEVT